MTAPSPGNNNNPNNTPNDFEEIFNRYRHSPDIVIKSRTWFDQQTRLLKNVVINERDLFKKAELDGRPIPGKFYLYYYDPKHKASLPYYDTFPLTIPYHIEKDRFLGLNFHYLGYYQRVRLLTKMMQFATNSTLNDETKIRYTWALIGHISRFAEVKHCIKEYLFSHVRSPFILVPPKDWHTAMMLPVARFVGRNQQNVWVDNSRTRTS